MRNPATFLKADWRYLVMLNYEVDPDLLLSLVPQGTELDLWEGKAIVSIVGFKFLHTRIFGVPMPFHGDFEEINLRFYVRRALPGGEVRHGVVFVRELIRKRAVAITAKLAYNEPYKVVELQNGIPPHHLDELGTLTYGWRTDGEWQRMAVTTEGPPAVPNADSETMFLSQRTWGYTRYHNGGTIEYKVEHEPWRVWEAHISELSPGFMDIYGPEFKAALVGPPRSVFVAEGSGVTVSMPRYL